jgi:hypothetical protein
MSSRRALAAFASSLQGLPGSSTNLSTRAVPNHPGRSNGCLRLLLRHRSVWLHPSRRTGHPRIPIEAESGSLALRLACSPPDSPAPSLELALVRLHAEQAIYMVNSFQFTRSARLSWHTDRKEASQDPHYVKYSANVRAPAHDSTATQRARTNAAAAYNASDSAQYRHRS